MMFKLSSVKKTKPSSSKRYFRKIPTTDQPSSSSKSDSNKNFNYYSNDQSFVLVYTVSKYEILHLFFLTILVTASSTFGSGIPVKQCVLFYLYRWVAGPEIKKNGVIVWAWRHTLQSVSCIYFLTKLVTASSAFGIGIPVKQCVVLPV